MKFVVRSLCFFLVFPLCHFEANISPVLELYRGMHMRTQSDSTSRTQQFDYFWAQLAMSSLHQLLEYDLEHHNEQMLDGLVGIRMAEGQLAVLLRRVPSIPTYLKDEISELVRLSKEVTNSSISAVAKANSNYYEVLGMVINEHFWEHDYPIRESKFDLVDPINSTIESLSEVVSDNCMSELLGTGDFDGQPCSISDTCWGTMTSPNYRLYSLTHEVIYLLIGETMGCANVMANSAKRFCHMDNRCRTLSELHQIFCANIISEMKELEKANFPGNRQDLFLEQVAVCGILGFKDACTVHWLKLMLSWQQESGCFKRTDNIAYGLKTMRTQYSNSFSNPNVNRKFDKRMDKTLSDGCSAHKTSVAAGALGVCIRFLIEDPPLSSPPA